ncbi:hypothetical protein U1Q18_007850, partial [Sarracenia purpurea var. burkii]
VMNEGTDKGELEASAVKVESNLAKEPTEKAMTKMSGAEAAKKASQKDEDKSECYEEGASEDEDNEGATWDDDEDSGEGESEDENVSEVMNEVDTAEATASVSISDKVKCPISEVSEPEKVLVSGVKCPVIDELKVEYESKKGENT